MTGLGQHAPQLLRMTADIVLHSTFPQAELQRELEVIRQEAIEYDEDPEDSSSDLLDRALWGDAPMGMPVIGTIENIEGFTRDDLVRTCSSITWRARPSSPPPATSTWKPGCALPKNLFGAMLASPGGAVSHPPEPAPHAGQAVARRFAQVSQVFLHLAYPLAGPQAPNATHRNAGAWPRRSPPTCRRRHVLAVGGTRCANGWAGLHGRRHHRQRRRMAQLRGACSDHAGQVVEALVHATGELLQAQAMATIRSIWNGRRTS